MVDMDGIGERLAAVRGRIERAASAAGRHPDEIRIIAVTKTHPVAVAQAAVTLGLDDLGENRVDELALKHADVAARWHLIGQLQRNKVRDVVGRVHLIHSVDRAPLVDAIGRHAVAHGLVQDVLVQVNVGDDPAKAGCRLADAAELVSYEIGRAHV